MHNLQTKRYIGVLFVCFIISCHCQQCNVWQSNKFHNLTLFDGIFQSKQCKSKYIDRLNKKRNLIAYFSLLQHVSETFNFDIDLFFQKRCVTFSLLDKESQLRSKKTFFWRRWIWIVRRYKLISFLVCWRYQCKLLATVRQSFFVICFNKMSSVKQLFCKRI